MSAGDTLDLPTDLAALDETSVRDPTGPRSRVEVVSPTSDWVTVLAAGGIATAGNAGNRVTTLAQILAHGSCLIHRVGGRGSQMKVRLGYDDGIADADVGADPVVQVFGVDAAGAFWPLRTPLDQDEITLEVLDTDYVEDGTLKYTAPQQEQTVDLEGAEWVVVIPKTAMVAAGKDLTNGVVQIKEF